MEKSPLLPLPPGCVVGRFIRRYKRFSVEMLLDGRNVWVHSNNSGSMLGLTQAGVPLLASPAASPARKLPYTQEAVWLAQRAVPPLPAERLERTGPPRAGAFGWASTPACPTA